MRRRPGRLPAKQRLAGQPTSLIRKSSSPKVTRLRAPPKAPLQGLGRSQTQRPKVISWQSVLRRARPGRVIRNVQR
ncbi:hypothetical protein BKA56DRAFT_585773 [Ilyonectria sp. MPI-CAGE-AT-0026]|nr:hypothetical protein BKA56DRAFT_585773 [Ilyonectria sp. MPI-CAGE-AT-0026]